VAFEGQVNKKEGGQSGSKSLIQHWQYDVVVVNTVMLCFMTGG